MAISHFACMLAVAAELHLPPRVLPAIQAIEGGRVRMSRMNSNGTEDLGLMQVNSLWLSAVARHTGQPSAAVRDKLIQDGCFNIAVAGAILRVYLREARGDLLAAVGNYHSHTPIRHRAYQLRVAGAALKMFGGRTKNTQ